MGAEQMADVKTTHCVDCSQEIEQTKRRGRPRKRCNECAAQRTKKYKQSQGWRNGAIRNCDVCGTKYTAKGPTSRYCSRACSCKASKDRKARQTPTHTCEGCGQEYAPRRADATSYCSRECYFASIKAEPEPPYTSVKFPVCGECGAVFVSCTNAHLCGDSCRQTRAKRKAREQAELEHNQKPRACKECGDTFTPVYGSKRRTFCSGECSRRWRCRANPSNHRRRARKYGVRYEWVNAHKVFDRDGWRCQICGRQTPKRLRGTRKATAPELDHRIPMCAGGAHAYDNVQCACRACNTEKHGTESVGQMPLLTG